MQKDGVTRNGEVNMKERQSCTETGGLTSYTARGKRSTNEIDENKRKAKGRMKKDEDLG